MATTRNGGFAHAAAEHDYPNECGADVAEPNPETLKEVMDAVWLTLNSLRSAVEETRKQSEKLTAVLAGEHDAEIKARHAVGATVATTRGVVMAGQLGHVDAISHFLAEASAKAVKMIAAAILAQERAEEIVGRME